MKVFAQAKFTAKRVQEHKSRFLRISHRTGAEKAQAERRRNDDGTPQAGRTIVLLARLSRTCRVRVGIFRQWQLHPTLSVTGPIRLELVNAAGDVVINGSADGKVHVQADVALQEFLHPNPQKRDNELVSNPRSNRRAIPFASAKIDPPPHITVFLYHRGAAGDGSQYDRGVGLPTNPWRARTVKAVAASGAIHVEHIDRLPAIHVERFD